MTGKLSLIDELKVDELDNTGDILVRPVVEL